MDCRNEQASGDERDEEDDLMIVSLSNVQTMYDYTGN